ncbi:MAG: hypothetical protein IT249_20015 [Chitinophagaceae bacterium]|nr:hypothetical protein [Chitinophagaceae bacterium]
MRRFIIISPKFDGQAELVYNEQEVLCLIDCTKSNMEEHLISLFKRAVPATIALLQTGNAFAPGTVITESNYVVSFKKFYDEYPLKRNRFRAEKIWQKLNGTQQVQAYYSLSHYKRYLHRTNIFAMGADRYLSERHFETEWKTI